jgi:serine/threonine protein kinase
MSYCLNPNCQKPLNPKNNIFCQHCGSKLILKERYRALKQIGQGGFGKTFLAVDEDIPSKPPCVIKQFLPLLPSNSIEKATSLFEQEAIQLNILGKHPQIPQLLAHFRQEDQLYLIQEFIDGQNLAEELAERGAFSETDIRQLLTSLLPVLQFVHENQVIHRDIKPENIIRRKSDDQLVLVDFGAAKFATGTALLRTGTAIGTAGYAAPEQSLGKANFTSDIYSLGITCLHLLTQIEPFELFDISENKWAWQDYLIHPVGKELSRILDKMVQMATKLRYQSAAEVLEDINYPDIKYRAKANTFNTNYYSSHQSNNSDSLRLVEIGSKYGYINHVGKLVIGLKFDQARSFSQDGLAAVKIGNKWGYIDVRGNVAIDPQFTEVLSFSEGLAPFKLSKFLGIRQTWGYINKNGDVEIDPQFAEALNFSEGLALIRVGTKWGYINGKGDLVINPEFAGADSFKQGLARVTINDKWGYIDQKGQITIPPRDNARNFSEGLAAVEVNKKWGYINLQGSLVIQPKFNLALDFSESLAPVLMDVKFLGLFAAGQRWGYIDNTGTVVISPQFDWALQFSQGLAAVKIGNKWGYINSLGYMVIQSQFELAGNFINGMAEVIVNGQCRYIDRTGKYIY